MTDPMKGDEMKWSEDCEVHGPKAEGPAKRQDAIQALNRTRKVLGYESMITVANTLEASPKPSETACALCGTDPARGNAIVYDDKYAPVGKAIHLCHGADQKISCYVQWTVYGARPAGPHKASERYLDAEDETALNECLESFGVAYVGFNGDPKIESVLEALETLRTHLRKKYYAG